jgi:hypothetical protein
MYVRMRVRQGLEVPVALQQIGITIYSLVFGLLQIHFQWTLLPVSPEIAAEPSD